MGNVIVSIADMAISDHPEDVLITYSLGSCLGITFFDPVRQIGGLLHCMLPLSQVDAQKAQANPWMFVDTGVTALLNELFQRGCRKKDIVTRVAGAARVLDGKDLFRIGERNFTVFRKIM